MALHFMIAPVDGLFRVELDKKRNKLHVSGSIPILKV